MKTVADFPRAELIDRARGGDVQALDRLLIVCRPDLERYARKHCGADDVEEAVQDALWILHRRLEGLRTVGAFAAWLFEIVKRECLKYLRRRRNNLTPEEIPPFERRDTTAVDAELRIVLAQIIASLPPDYRDVLLMRDIQGLSATEASSRLSISIEAAKSRLHRARAMVRNQLTESAPAPQRTVA